MSRRLAPNSPVAGQTIGHAHGGASPSDYEEEYEATPVLVRTGDLLQSATPPAAVPFVTPDTEEFAGVEVAGPIATTPTAPAHNSPGGVDNFSMWGE